MGTYNELDAVLAIDAAKQNQLSPTAGEGQTWHKQSQLLVLPGERLRHLHIHQSVRMTRFRLQSTGVLVPSLHLASSPQTPSS